MSGGLEGLQSRLNARLMDAISNIPADAPELATLMQAWTEAKLPKASEGQVPPERFGEAMALIYRHASKYQPFPEPKPEEPVCEADRWSRIASRYFALPADLAEQTSIQGAHLPSPSTPVVTVAQAEAWDALLAHAEEQADRRRREACEVFRLIYTLEHRSLVCQLLTGDVTTWTEKQVNLYRALWSCCDCGFLVGHDGELRVDALASAELAETEGKRACVALAKAKAKEYGITPVPSKWDDLVSNPLLYAAVVAA